MLVGELRRWGTPLADLEPLLPHVDRALDWVRTHGDRDGDGFVEYERATPHGLVNQGWKDSFDGITLRRGALPHAPIALAEVQGYVYGALRARVRAGRRLRRPRAGPRPGPAGRCAEARVQRPVLAPAPRPPRPRPRRRQAAGRRHSRPTWATACGPASSTRSTRPRSPPHSSSPEMFSGFGRAHAGLVDGRLQPDELPQRLDLAARQRPGRGRAAALRVRRGGPAGRRAASSTRRRRSADGCPSCSAVSTATRSPRRSPTRRPALPQAWAAATPLLLLRVAARSGARRPGRRRDGRPGGARRRCCR